MKTEMSTKKRMLGLVLTLAMLVSMMPSMAITVVADDPGDEALPGTVTINKSAKAVENDYYSFDMQLSIKGYDKVDAETAHVVLVMDTSGSMTSGGSTRLEDSQLAAKALVDALMLPYSKVEIGLVSFSQTATKANGGDFYTLGEKKDLTDAIDALKATGGTNIQDGLMKAQEMLENVDEGHKYIVLLSDGAPTYSYTITDAEAYGGWTDVEDTTRTHNFRGTKFSTQSKGSGSLYTFNPYTVTNNTDYSVSDNGIATISQAYLTKEDDIEIFTINLDGDEKGDQYYVLLNCATDKDHVYTVDTEKLTEAFTDIAGKISYAIEDGVVTDPMGSYTHSLGTVYFDLVPDSISVYWMDGSTRMDIDINIDDYIVVSQNEEGRDVITWNVGTVMEQQSPIYLEYRITIPEALRTIGEDISSLGILLPTNGRTTLKYIDIEEKEITLDFNIPEIVLPNTRGTIIRVAYLVDESGVFLDENGLPLDDRLQGDEQQAYELAREKAINDKKDEDLLYGTPLFYLDNSYVIATAFDDQDPLYGYAPYVKDGGEPEAQIIVPASEEVERILYFPYYKIPGETVTVNYYKGSVDAANLIGSDAIHGQEAGTTFEQLEGQVKLKAEDAGITVPPGYFKEGTIDRDHSLETVIKGRENVISVVLPANDEELFEYQVEHYYLGTGELFDTTTETIVASGGIITSIPRSGIAAEGYFIVKTDPEYPIPIRVDMAPIKAYYSNSYLKVDHAYYTNNSLVDSATDILSTKDELKAGDKTISEYFKLPNVSPSYSVTSIDVTRFKDEAAFADLGGVLADLKAKIDAYETNIPSGDILTLLDEDPETADEEKVVEEDEDPDTELPDSEVEPEDVPGENEKEEDIVIPDTAEDENFNMSVSDLTEMPAEPVDDDNDADADNGMEPASIVLYSSEMTEEEYEACKAQYNTLKEKLERIEALERETYEGTPESLLEYGYCYEIAIRYDRTTSGGNEGGGNGGGDEWEGGGDGGTTGGTTGGGGNTNIPDEDVPLADIPDEEVPLGDLPTTGGGALAKTAGMAALASGSLLLLGKRKFFF